jgi:hypothetical protein
MHDQEPSESTDFVERSYAIYYVLAAVGAPLLIGAYLLFGGSTTSKQSTSKTEAEHPAQIVREELNKSTEINTCRDALTRISQLLNQRVDGNAPRPSTGDRGDSVRKLFDLRDDEWAEVNNNAFTLLDGHYLVAAFLLRDAAASFTRDGALINATPLQRAEIAFAWTVRQVRLQEARDGIPLPVEIVLHRGSGTPLERALVFLELLRQFDVPGCLLATEEPGAGPFPLWTCGALDGQDIYLFDPRMGTAVPGSNGSGVATLAAAQSQPDLLKQLSADDARYDVTAEQAKKARVYLAPPLSALAPRISFLEKVLQDPELAAPVINARLSVDAAQLCQQFEKALAMTGQKDHPAVRSWPPAVRALRTLLPVEEGGLDKSKPPRMSLLRATVIPIQRFPPIIHNEMGKVYERLFEQFAGRFMSLYFEPQQPRDLLLRGHFNEASRPLTALRRETIDQKKRLEENPEMFGRVRESLDSVLKAQVDLQRAQRLAGDDPQNPAFVAASEKWEGAWKQGQVWLDALVNGAAAGPLGQEVNYQLALVKHEQAERLQLRLDNTGRAAQATAGETDARRAWQNAADSWGIYLQEYADAPTAPAARFNACRVQLMLGERESAVDLLKDLSKLTDLEKVGRLALARKLEQKK